MIGIPDPIGFSDSAGRARNQGERTFSPMRTTDKDRFWDLGRQLRDIREGCEDPAMNTHDLAKAVGRPQPWISEVENGMRYPDVFDFVRLCRALGVTNDLAMELLEGIVDDRLLDVTGTPRVPTSRPKKGAKRRRTPRTRL